MDNKKKIAAGGAALLIGAMGYGVYATTLTVTDNTTSFAAGSGAANQVEGFGAVTVDAGSPEFSKNEYYFSALSITPVDGANWKNVGTKTIKVVAYDKEGAEIGSGEAAVNESLGTSAETVKLDKKPNANQVVTWGIVVQ